MRTLSSFFCLPLLVLLATASQKPGDKGAATPSANPVPTAVLTPLEGAAKQLAKGGRERETKELLSVLERLGYPETNLEKLEKACKEDIAKAKIAVDSFPAAAKLLRAAVTQLTAIMEKLEAGDQKSQLARRILMLDGDCEAAHLVLGHQKVAKSWVRADLKSLRERRAEILAKVEEAKKLVVDVERGQVDDEFVTKACGVKATMVRRSYWELRSNFSVEKTERILRETERALALSDWLRGKKFQLPPVSSGKSASIVWVLIDSREQFRKLATELAAAGKLSEDDVKLLNAPDSNIGAFNVKGGPRIVLAQIETHVQAGLLMQRTAMREGLQSPLTAGHLNWLSLTCFGCTLPGSTYKEGGGKGYGDTKVKGDTSREREEMMRMAKAGIAGSRGWMQYLAERGEDPLFGNSFVQSIGAITGNDLHKCTSIVEFLHEAGLFNSTFKKLSTASGSSAQSYAEALEMPLGELESKWRDWLLGVRPGLAERIDKENLNAWPRDALAVLEYMNRIRDATFKGRVEGAWQLKFDPTLSEQCALHAHYLTLHPEQQKWPDAHEEYADKEGYTVEGMWAGSHSVIVWGSLKDYTEAVDGWMGTFYHRLPLIDPGVLRLGWGSEDIYCVMDMSSLAAPFEAAYTVVYPYENQADVPTNFNGDELPDPVPNGAAGSVNESEIFGYPVTIQTNPIDDKGEVVDIDMKLFEGKDGKVEVECHYSSPTRPSNPELAPAGAWCLIPKAPLKQKTDYKVVADWKNTNKTVTGTAKHMEWTFRTK